MADELIEMQAQAMVMGIAGVDMANNAGSIALMSSAISLKRIADALTAQPGPVNIFDMLTDIATNSGRDRI